LQIDRRLNGHDLLSEDFHICASELDRSFTIGRSARIGVDYAGHWARRHLRFYVKDNPFVSRAAR
jgi:DNA-3-methyladenine glycosylase